MDTASSHRLAARHQPHHDGSARYVGDLAPHLGQRVDLLVRVPAGQDVERVFLRSVPDGEPHFTAAVVDRVDGSGTTWWRAVLEMVNPEMNYRFWLHTPEGGRWLTAAGLHDHDLPDATDFRLTTHPAPPAWAGDAVVYQIFPDRYHRSGEAPLASWARPADWDTPLRTGDAEALQQMYGGDLWGVVRKIDHIQRLGATVIYLTPFFEGRSNHRYDAVSFDRVDPALGGDEALIALTAEAHRRGIKVIGDITLNHSGDGHDWFRTAQSDPRSPEAGFYFFGDGGPEDYATFLGVRTLPTFDHRSAELRRRLYEGPDSVIAKYLGAPFHLDGWRVDVAQMAGRRGDVELNHLVATTTAATVRAANPGAVLLAEHQHDASLALAGDGWQGTMSYAGFTRPVWSWLVEKHDQKDFWAVPGPVPDYDAARVRATMTAFGAALPWRSRAHNLTLLDSHDTARFRTFAGPERQLLGAALLFTLPGIPMVFSGDEVGVLGEGLEEGRKPFPWDESAWDQHTWRTYRDLVRLRRSHSALTGGGLRWLVAEGDVLLFEREDERETVLVQISRADHPPVAGEWHATHLLGGPQLVPGRDLPAEGPAVHVWSVAR
ncbi:glycoside hydrolase family 13 protein [Kitasatospora sp. NPDC058115]|uniref:glycoside hydrolase family 13 protein n=1 Tax=Kitasatospora sp. NPDC058115 TaxID=3346347 RepID=UPI0036DECAB1